MTVHTFLSEEAMIERAVEALLQALGPVETARFLALPRKPILDSVEWHRQWQAALDANAFLDHAFADPADTGAARTSPAQ